MHYEIHVVLCTCSQFHVGTCHKCRTHEHISRPLQSVETLIFSAIVISLTAKRMLTLTAREPAVQVCVHVLHSLLTCTVYVIICQVDLREAELFVVCNCFRVQV